jgi:hypothetical protein
MPWTRHCEIEDGTRTVVETRRIDRHAASAFRSSFATSRGPITLRHPPDEAKCKEPGQKRGGQGTTPDTYLQRSFLESKRCVSILENPKIIRQRLWEIAGVR